MASEVLKLFVGDGHFFAQNTLANKRRAEGWIIGRVTDDENILQALQTTDGKVVIVNGADAGMCVAAAVHLALEGGHLVS